MAASTSTPTQIDSRKLSNRSKAKLGRNSPSKKGKGKGKENTFPDRRIQESTEGTAWDKEDLKAYEWYSLTDPSSSKFPPIFSKDGKYFFALSGPSVKINSVATGKTVSTLTAPLHKKIDSSLTILTSAIINPQNAFQLITSSLDGRLMTWDFTDATLLQTVDIEQPIHHLCAHKELKDVIFVAVTRSIKRKDEPDANAVILRVSLKVVDATVLSTNSKSQEILPVGKIRFPTGLAISPNGAWLVATANHKVYVAQMSLLASGFTKYVSPERLTCLKFHPKDEYFATGDEKGVIRLWYCLNDNLASSARGVEKRTQTTALHWHAHSVSSIAFSSNGAYLLSGGEESVLVIWQLHSGKKEFVPRVGAPISVISVTTTLRGEEEYLLGLADATFLFLNAGSLKITRSFSRIKISPTSLTELRSTSKLTLTPLAVHNLTSTLVLPSSHPSSLQVYSPATATLVSELEISPSNRVSRRDERPIEPTRVAWTVISTTGRWMATVDTRQDESDFRYEVYLKFWAWDEKATSWCLNTKVDRPHGLKKIIDVRFSTFADDHSVHLATAGEDGHVKLWKLLSHKNGPDSNEVFWASRSTFDFRSRIPCSLSWAPDASLLAISFGLYVVLYDPSTACARDTIIVPELKVISSVHFIGATGRFLLMIGKSRIVLWDLILQSMKWQYTAPVPIQDVIPHQLQESFTVFFTNQSGERLETRASVFNSSSSIPIDTRRIPFGLQNIACYSPGRSSVPTTFVGITKDWGVVMFGNQVQSSKEEGLNLKDIDIDHGQNRNLLQNFFGRLGFNEPVKASVTSSDMLQDKAKGNTSLFDGPAYLIPSLNILYDSLLEPFLTRKRDIAQESISASIDHESEDINMDEDHSVPPVLTTPRNRESSQEEISRLTELFRGPSFRISGHSPDSIVNAERYNTANVVVMNGASIPNSVQTNQKNIAQQTMNKSQPLV